MINATMLSAAALAACVAGAAQATLVDVQIDCTVEYNQIAIGSLGDVIAGDSAVWTFQVDSDVYMDSPTYNTRGYNIIESGWQFAAGPAVLGLQDPFPGTPYFVVRNDDPAADGFIFSDNTDWPADLPMDETGAIGQFASHFEVGYTGDTLSSLDIMDAAGTYDYTGLTSFYTVIMDGWAEPIGLEFVQMTITPSPASAALLVLAPLGLASRRRRN